MAGFGNPTKDARPLTLQEKNIMGREEHVVIIASSWHDAVMNGLIAGAQRCCEEAQCSYEIVRVPGSFELPLAAQVCANEATTTAIVALGVVIRGGTPHFDYVCDAATEGLTHVALSSGKPVGFGLLTCDDEEQARDRAGLDGSHEDKGYEAALAAIDMQRMMALRRRTVAE